MLQEHDIDRLHRQALRLLLLLQLQYKIVLVQVDILQSHETQGVFLCLVEMRLQVYLKLIDADWDIEAHRSVHVEEGEEAVVMRVFLRQEN